MITSLTNQPMPSLARRDFQQQWFPALKLVQSLSGDNDFGPLLSTLAGKLPTLNYLDFLQAIIIYHYFILAVCYTSYYKLYIFRFANILALFNDIYPCTYFTSTPTYRYIRHITIIPINIIII